MTSKNIEGGEEKTAVSWCVTSYQHVDGKDALIAGAPLWEIDGQDKKHLLVTTPPDAQVRPEMNAQLLPRDLWDACRRQENPIRARRPA